MSEVLATASVRIIPDPASLAAFRTTLMEGLAAAVKAPIPVPVVAVAKTAGVTTAAADTKVLTAATAESAVVMQAAGAAAVEESAALKTSAAAAAKAAAAHEQFARGGGASILTMLGIRGATLAASAPFLLGTAAVVTFSKSLREASAEAEAFARVQKILGAQAEQSREWAQGLAQSFGLSATAALKAEGAIAEVLHVVHIAPADIAPMSQALVQLAADMAAFNNVPVEDTLRALQLGISGNMRSLRQYGVILRQVDVTNEALRESGKKAASELTRQNMVTARINLIMRDVSNQTGAFAARQGDAAAQAKILKSDLANLGAGIGTTVLPILTSAVSDVDTLIQAFKRLGSVKITLPTPEGTTHSFGLLKTAAIAAGLALARAFPTTAIAAVGLRAIDINLKVIQANLDKVRSKAQEIKLAETLGREGQTLSASMFHSTAAIVAFVQAGGTIKPTMDAASASEFNFVKASEAVNAALGSVAANMRALSVLQNQFLVLEFQGASSAVLIANLNKQIARDTAIIRRTGGKGKASEQALAERVSLQAQIKSIRAQDEAAAKAAQAAADKAASEAQRALDAQDQAIADQFSLNAGAAQLAELKAQRTKSLVDDLAEANKTLAVLEKQLVTAQNIHDVTTRLQTIQTLQQQIEQKRQDIKALQEQQRQNQIDRRNLIRDRESQRLDLAIQLAQVTKNTSAEIALREKRIKFDQEQLKTVHGDLVRAGQLKLEIAQERAAIADLTRAKADLNRQLAFSFLQSRQGFAATLLSNLLPVGAIRNTVGGAGGVMPAALGPGMALASAGAVSGAAGGITRGQGGSMIDLLRGIYGALAGSVAGARFPEARTASAWASASMANMGLW